MNDFDPYRILDIERAASQEAIREAYRTLARRFHPDVADDPETQDRMVRVNAAWELLGDAERRAAWDLAHGGRPMSPRDRHSATQDGNHTSIDGDHEPTARAWLPSVPPGTGAAGPPPGRPSGSVLDFGRHLGWSLGEIARVDPGYLLWLESRPEGQPHGAELDTILRRLGIRRSDPGASAGRRFGLG